MFIVPWSMILPIAVRRAEFNLKGTHPVSFHPPNRLIPFLVLTLYKYLTPLE